VIYLTTGANGAGKTLFTLADVRAQQLKENRPVYYHGFEAADPLKAFGWLPFEPRDWMALPDGSICIMDEAQNEFPLRKSGSDVPRYIEDIAQFRRKRGFDFWITTPHPMLIDVFIRRLIGSPSWHRHCKRVFGSNMTSISQWSSVKTDCEKPTAGDSGQTSLRAFPKEVFTWYNSASLHTGKRKFPLALKLLAVAVLAVPLAGWFAVNRISSIGQATQARLAEKGIGSTAANGAAPSAATSAVVKPRSLEQLRNDYLLEHSPRIAGLPQTAPVYDKVTDAVVAPYPAACLFGVRPGTRKAECKCWTQQGTLLQTPLDLCSQVVAQGFFVDFKLPAPSGREKEPPAAASSAPAAPAFAVMPVTVLAAGKVAPDAVAPPDPAREVADGQMIRAIRAAKHVIR
jgi:zona occludens toxin